MSEFIIDSSHFSGVLQAVEYMMSSAHQFTDVELLCDEEEEVYVLRTHDKKYKLAIFPY